MGYREQIDARLTAQRGLVATWQLRADGCSEKAIRWAISSMREMHSGVHLSGHAPPTQWQLWKAAELTTPDTRLGLWSGAAHLGFRERDRMPTTVVRQGSGGPRGTGRQVRAETSTVAAEAERTFAVSRGAVNVRSTSPGRSATRSQLASLRAFYSSAFLDEDTTVVDDIKVLCAARVLLDLMPRLSDKGASRHVRDALRLKSVTALELNAMAAKHHGRRGVRRLKHYADLYGSLPVTRTRSDAEIVAAEWIAAARMPMPLINIVVAGEEGDLVYPEYGRIIELDGPQFHQFRAEDDRKQRIWEAAGWKVDRLPTDDVYDHPHKLLAIAPRHGDPKNPLSVRLPPPGGR